jgi:hypothetical protein
VRRRDENGQFVGDPKSKDLLDRFTTAVQVLASGQGPPDLVAKARASYQDVLDEISRGRSPQERANDRCIRWVQALLDITPENSSRG